MLNRCDSKLGNGTLLLLPLLLLLVVVVLYKSGTKPHPLSSKPLLVAAVAPGVGFCDRLWTLLLPPLLLLLLVVAVVAVVVVVKGLVTSYMLSAADASSTTADPYLRCTAAKSCAAA
jgi:hypothetical protein